MKPVSIPPPHIHRGESDCSRCEDISSKLFPQYSQDDLKMPPTSLQFAHHHLEQPHWHCRGSAYSARGPALRGRWLFRMNSRTRQSQTVPHCLDVSPAASSRPVSLLREILTAASSRPRRPTPHTGGRVQYSLHDVFVDTHGSRTPLDPAIDDQTRTTAERPSLNFLTSSHQVALLAEFAHRCVPVTTCITSSTSRPIDPDSRHPGVWARDQDGSRRRRQYQGGGSGAAVQQPR